MLAFTKLGKLSRLGNQLFQYAFLRTQAEKLGVKFYCPHWVGDEIFHLNDEYLRNMSHPDLRNVYTEPLAKEYDRDNLEMKDDTEIIGNFESEKHFNVLAAREWYSFREEKIRQVKNKYAHLDFSKSVGIHLRLGDKQKSNFLNKIYFIPRIQYYNLALKYFDTRHNVLIFSDDIPTARKYFRNLKFPNIVYMESNKDWEDLYLMSQCNGFVCGASTLSWWGAWLQNNKNKMIIFPQEGIYRPGSGYRNSEIIPLGWKKLSALHPIWGHYIINAFPLYNLHHKGILLLGSLAQKYFPRVFLLIAPYFRNRF